MTCKACGGHGYLETLSGAIFCPHCRSWWQRLGDRLRSVAFRLRYR